VNKNSLGHGLVIVERKSKKTKNQKKANFEQTPVIKIEDNSENISINQLLNTLIARNIELSLNTYIS
jgi:hypothetical protein